MQLLYIHDEALTSEKANIIQVLQMCNAFADLNVNVNLAVPHDSNARASMKEVIKNKLDMDIKFSVLTYPTTTIAGRLKMIGGYVGVMELLKTTNADLCFVRNPFFLNLTIDKKIPTFFESHASLLHERSRLFDFFWKKNLIKNSKSPYVIKFIAISKALGDIWVSRGIPKQKIIHLHDGVDSDNFLVMPDKNELRKSLDLPFKKKIVTYAGSLYKNRGIEKILKLAVFFPEVLFLVIGGPKDRKNHYFKMAEQQMIKNILFIGTIPYYKVKNYLYAADVLLMIWTKDVKTIKYCSPLKMFEYMASGRIIVGDGYPTIKEVLRDKKTAYLSYPESFEDLKSNLSLALNQSYPNSMAQSARILSFKEYSWKIRAQKILTHTLQ